MSPAFPARRRAEQFDSLVEGASTGPVDARYVELLELVGALRDTAPAEPRPAFVADLRERLMLAAETELAGAPAAAVQDRLTLPRRSPRERRLAVVVGGFAIVGATTSMAVAAQSALPGDTLYPLKRAIENAETGFSMDDEAKGATLLANASSRLQEVDELTRGTEPKDLDVRTIEETLDTFTSQATEASDLLLTAYASDADPGKIAELQDFTEQSFQSLNELAAVATDEVRDALVPVGNALVAIEAAVQQACPACGDVLTSIPPWMLQASGQLAEGLQGLVPSTEEVVAPPPATADPGRGVRPGRGAGTGGGGQSGSQDGGSSGSTSGGGTDPVVPVVPTPGAGGDTGGSGGGTGTGGAGEKTDPIKDLINGITGGGSSATEAPEVPVVGDVVEGVGEVVDGLTDPLKP